MPGEVEVGAGVAEGDVLERFVGDVLAEPDLAGALEVDHRREPFELAGLEFEALELVAVDLERQVGEGVEGRPFRGA